MSTHTITGGVSYDTVLVNNEPIINQVRLTPFNKQAITSFLDKIPNDSLIRLNFDLLKLESNLKTTKLGRNLIYAIETTSTMDIAQKLLSNLPDGTIIIAECQTQGYGRQGRVWSSSPSGNLYFTLLVHFKMCVNEITKLNCSASLCVAQTCKDFGLESVRVKWPNDVWIRDKKISGMIVKSSILGQNVIAQVGIGINVNEDMLKNPNSELRLSATSLYNNLNKRIDRELFLSTLLQHFESYLGMSWESVLQIYKSFDCLVGNEVIVMPKLKENPERIKAKAVGFDNEGRLLVKIGDDEDPTPLMNEEVTVRPSAL